LVYPTFFSSSASVDFKVLITFLIPVFLAFTPSIAVVHLRLIGYFATLRFVTDFLLFVVVLRVLLLAGFRFLTVVMSLVLSYEL